MKSKKTQKPLLSNYKANLNSQDGIHISLFKVERLEILKHSLSGSCCCNIAVSPLCVCVGGVDLIS